MDSSVNLPESYVEKLFKTFRNKTSNELTRTCNQRQADSLDESHDPTEAAAIQLLSRFPTEQVATLKDNKQWTLLHHASYRGWYVAVKLLVEQYKSDINAKSNDGSENVSKMNNGQTPLHLACKNGHLEVAKFLVLGQECDPSCKMNNGQTPLHLACKNGHLDVAKFLVLEQKCESLCKMNDGRTPLHLACQHGHLNVAKFLILEQKCDPSCKVNDSRTPLHLASQNGHLNIAQFLVIEQKCVPSCKMKNGQTPLHLACQNGHVDLAKFFIFEQKCDQLCNDDDGWAPLHLACQKGHLDVVKLLVRVQTSTLDPLCKDIQFDSWTNNALHLACMYGHLHVVQFLVFEQEIVSCIDGDANGHGWTPLHTACENGHLDVAKFLVLEQNCDPTCKDVKGCTPLHVACINGYLDVVKFFILETDKCDLSCKNNDGWTLLHSVCENGNLDIAKFLVLEQKCDLSRTNNDGQTPLNLARQKGHLDVANFLFSQMIQKYDSSTFSDSHDLSLLHLACKNGDLNIAKFLIHDENHDPSCKNMHGWTPLHSACHNGKLEVAKFLILEKKCNALCKDYSGWTPLHLACENGHLDLVKFLVRETNSRNPFLNDHSGWTPLHLASENGHLDVVKFLVLKQNCYPLSENSDGWTPLHLACQNGHLHVVKFLTRDCKPPSICKNNDGWTPLHSACRNGQLDVAKFLIFEQKYNPLCKNNTGLTPIHSACKYGHLNVIKFLCLSKKFKNQSCKDIEGWTPLHIACLNGRLDIVKFFVCELKCDILCKNNFGWTPLHSACRNGHLNVVKFLTLEQECNPSCKDKRGKIPMDTAKLNQYPDVERFLLTAGSIAKPSKLGFPGRSGAEFKSKHLYQHFPAFKVLILGDRSVGKSTLAKAFELKLTKRFNLSRNVSNVVSPTAGIDTIRIHGFESGRIVIYDFAGHREYHSSHSAVLSYLGNSQDTLFLIVIDLTKCPQEIISTLSYWYLFIKKIFSTNATKNITTDIQVPLLHVVGSHKDVLKAKGVKATRRLLDAINELDLSLGASLSDKHTVLNCKILTSRGLTFLCNLITKHSKSFHKQNEFSLDVRLHFFAAVIKESFYNKMACQLKEIATIVASGGYSSFRENDLLPTTIEKMSQCLLTLAKNGEFVYFENVNDIPESWLILNEAALLSKVNGTIFSPDNFGQHPFIANSIGVVPLIKIKEIFPNYDTDMIMEFLTHLEFCQRIPKKIKHVLGNCHFDAQVSDEIHYFFPALISEDRPANIYASFDATNKSLVYKCGWCVRCVNNIQFFTPNFLHTLLLHLAFELALPLDQTEVDCPVIQRECNMWKTGIQWLNGDGVEAIVELVDQSRAIIVRVGSLKGKEMACVSLRSKLIKTIIQIKNKFAMNTDIKEYFIHPKQLNNFEKGMLNCHTFSTKKLARVIQNGKDIVTSKNDADLSLQQIEIEELLYFEPYMCTHFTNIDSEVKKDKFTESNKFLYKIKNDTSLKPSYAECFQEMFASEFLYNKTALADIKKQVDGDPGHQCCQILARWRNHTPEPTYEKLKLLLDKYTIFCDKDLEKFDELCESVSTSTDTMASAHDETYQMDNIVNSLKEDNKPKLIELLSLTDYKHKKKVKVIQDTASKWKFLATALGFTGPRIDSIEMGAHFQPEEACYQIFTNWLEGDGELREPVTWKTLIQCLIDAGLLDTAEDLEELILC